MYAYSDPSSIPATNRSGIQLRQEMLIAQAQPRGSRLNAAVLPVSYLLLDIRLPLSVFGTTSGDSPPWISTFLSDFHQKWG